MNEPANRLALIAPYDRPDRLLAITGHREEELAAEYSADGGTTWHGATLYPGASADEWRAVDLQIWNQAVLEHRLLAGEGTGLWNYFFDLDLPNDRVRFRLRAGDAVVLDRSVDLPTDSFVIDSRNARQLAGGVLPEPWSLRACEESPSGIPSLVAEVRSREYDSEYPTAYVENAHLPPLVLRPGLSGWHRVYLGMEPAASVCFALSGDDPFRPVPGEAAERPMREWCVARADLTGREVRLAPGGARVWKDASVRYIRFVPMSEAEVGRFLEARRTAETEGRPFAGYLEPVTVAYYEGETISLRDYTRNEMRLHRQRGCTDVYVHVIRIGFSAWYHSGVVEWFMPEGEAFRRKDPAQLKWTAWMEQGDPMAVAVEEARGAGLGVFADLGMNITYLGVDRFHYAAYTGRFAKDHPEYACAEDRVFLDYRHAAVRDYAESIAAELMTAYDVDGLHLDFARFASNKAFDAPGLIDLMERIHGCRRAAEEKWGHPLRLAVRIPSYRYHHWERYTGEYPEFLEALRVWAQNGWIDRVMACAMPQDHRSDLSLARYRDALSGTGVELWGDLYAIPPDQPRTWLLDLARRWRKEGLDGGFFLYESGRPVDLDAINWQLRLLDAPARWRDFE